DSGDHGATQVAGAPERREDEDPALGHHAMEFGRRRQPVGPGHLDVEQRNVGPQGGRGLDHVVAGGQSLDHLHVGLHAEQRREGIPHHALILREQDPDRIGYPGPPAVTRRGAPPPTQHPPPAAAPPPASACGGPLAPKGTPPPASRPASRCPPTERTRSARPVSPLPGSVSRRNIGSDGVPLPSSTTSTRTVP